MPFTPPMYASPMPNPEKNPKLKPFVYQAGLWGAQEKIDGIRLITEVSSKTESLFVNKGVTSWTRYANVRPLPPHIRTVMDRFPNCILDGELCAPGKRSYGTMDLDNTEDLVYYLFDLLVIEDVDVMSCQYLSRLEGLYALFSSLELPFEGGPVQILPFHLLNSWSEVTALYNKIRERDGEGLILKKRASGYMPGKRPKDWVKMKALIPGLFTITGFAASRGEINDRGPYAMTLLMSDDGVPTRIKTKNDAQCRQFEIEGAAAMQAGVAHPAIGRKLWCEYQERTPDASFRHIRWDRWDGE